MKTKNILLMLLITVISMSKIKAQDSLVRHSVHVSPFAGYNATLKAAVYGAEVGYEYRLNKNWGLTAGVNIAYTQKNADGSTNMVSNGVSQFKNMKFLQNAIYAGAKYYIGRFYLSADLGYQEAYSTTNYTYQGAGSSYNNGTSATNGFYQAYGLGYQLPLKKGDNIEFFAKGSNGNSNTSYVAGFRYNFGLFRRK
ncbi:MULTISPECIES: autotransporter outer membrane beta-barrel domain-containing protein [unclassified Pedobacter]|uniref:autotransporter outer membrane beta-barrel domain-containing protein n=1 Tax=unclassified Pedobacter TaxID=2628915 RepID=UPI000B4A5C9E|nr:MULTISPECIES: autotransporter outer membrane beta-barrel domain-containing protein [unclassified Pedobacter]MCX2432543.1 autotransporter outer membrane beta-barrel domain-containing protein [Pedobacter sp. GR22-10]MCX2583368.1 autotransporter outer membrane beta-barrel domain-containing protein [Pedobacter sp. MR22-3]OWK72062.1 hypothetical protein CBW18_00315 [Pedobacter sp. AJM]